MKALFVHDHYFAVDGDKSFSDKLPYDVFLRYLTSFNSVHVVGRSRQASGDDFSLPRSDGPGVTFDFFPSASDMRTVLSGGGKLRPRLREMVQNVDVVICRLPSELGLLACSLARNMGKTYIIEVVGCAWDALWNYGSKFARAYAPALYARMRDAVGRAPFVSYVSQDFLQRRYPPRLAKITVAVSNVELPSLDPRVLATRLERIDSGHQPYRIGLIGSLKTRYKGVDTAISSIAKASKTRPIELHVLGSGDSEPYRRQASQLGVGDLTFFDGSLPTGAPVFEWLDKADLYIQPSLQEGVPRALIEAMSRGCPSIATICGGIPELLECDSLVRKADSNQLSTAIDKALGNPRWLRSAAAANFARAKSYEKNILDARRTSFLSSVIAEADFQR